MSERRERYAAMYELRELARWVEQHFNLSSQPKIHSAQESEVIYAQILKRIAGLANDEPWRTQLPPGPDPYVTETRVMVRPGEWAHLRIRGSGGGEWLCELLRVSGSP